MSEFAAPLTALRARVLTVLFALVWTGGTSVTSAQDNPNARPVTVTVTANPPVVTQPTNLAAGAPMGDTSVSGMTPSFGTPQQGGGAPTLKLGVATSIKINPKSLNQSYTVAEDGPCKGTTFNMTADFIEAHEREHVAQIQRELKQFLDDNLTYNERDKTFNLAGFGGPLIGSGFDPNYVQKIQLNLDVKVQQLVVQDKAEYAQQTFNKPGLEHDARAKACEKFMNDMGNQLNRLIDDANTAMNDAEKTLKDATDALDAANTQATAAAAAANAALLAAKACDLAAFRKALKQYEDAKKQAEDKLKAAQALLDRLPNQLTAVSTAISAYEAAKTNAALGITVTKFPPGDAKREKIEPRRKAADAKAKEQAKRPDVIKKKLDRAADIVKQAYEELKKCKEAKDKTNKTWQTFREEHETEMGDPTDGAANAPADSPRTPRPSPPPSSGNATPPGNTTPSGNTPPPGNTTPPGGSGAGTPPLKSALPSFGAADARVLDFGQASQFADARPRPRQKDTQLMMIDVVSVDVPGTQMAGSWPVPPGVRGFFARVWSALANPMRGAWASRSSAPSGFWLAPLGAGGGQGVTRAARVHAYLRSLGTSTGEAFDIQVVNDGTAPIRIGGDGIVVEPIKQGEDKDLRAELRQIAARGAGTAGAASVKANAYCLEFKLKPPELNDLFRVSDAATQQQYTAAREILRASRRLQAAGALQPDSDPPAYYHAIKQWSLWVSEQRFTLASYRKAFIERTKKNAAALGTRWSQQIEDGISGLVPHRWDEMTKILREARQPVPGA